MNWGYRNTEEAVRRLSIAMGIVHRPVLVFSDEPTAGLDAQGTQLIRNLIRQLNVAES